MSICTLAQFAPATVFAAWFAARAGATSTLEGDIRNSDACQASRYVDHGRAGLPGFCVNPAARGTSGSPAAGLGSEPAADKSAEDVSLLPLDNMTTDEYSGSIPEPGTLPLLGLGAAVMAVRKRRQQASRK